MVSIIIASFSQRNAHLVTDYEGVFSVFCGIQFGSQQLPRRAPTIRAVSPENEDRAHNIIRIHRTGFLQSTNLARKTPERRLFLSSFFASFPGGRGHGRPCPAAPHAAHGHLGGVGGLFGSRKTRGNPCKLPAKLVTHTRTRGRPRALGFPLSARRGLKTWLTLARLSPSRPRDGCHRHLPPPRAARPTATPRVAVECRKKIIAPTM